MSQNGSNNFIKWFNEIGKDDWKVVGGKNCSLGEIYTIYAPPQNNHFLL